MENPPSITKFVPVIYEDASHPRNNAAYATSSGLHILFKGVLRIYFFKNNLLWLS